MNRTIVKNTLIVLGTILLFLVLSYGFVPEVLSGKVVNQSDITGYMGMAHEASEWNAAHPDDKTAWTGAMFGGMPTTMITGNNTGDATRWLYKTLLFGRRPASYLFISLLGAFLLMLSLGVNWILAIGGAIAMSFCSYNMQIIQVGHNTKMQALAFLPWVLAAVIFTYKSALKDTPEGGAKRSWLWQTLLGAVLFGFALNFQIKANHVQISYYLAIMILSYVVVQFISLLVCNHSRKVGKFLIASVLLLALGIVGIATNANNLIPTYLYTQETMRGGSDLTSDGDEPSKGLDLDYATAWSYGWNELPNLMIPNFNGGSSVGELSMDSETVTLLKQAGQPNLRQTAKSMPLYWGPQPFTAGPMYMGAISVFLFILGLFVCRGSDKWWILLATLVAVCLATGYHFMGFTKFWFYHVPFYNKFRTVSMALVVLQYTLPMLGFLALDNVLNNEYNKKGFAKKNMTVLVITGGFCLLCILIPSIAGSFTSPSDSGYPDVLVAALQADRRSLMVKDAWTSLLLIFFAWLLIHWAGAATDTYQTKQRRVFSGIALCFLILINLFSVGKRYLNSGHFTPEKKFNSQFSERIVDELIYLDESLGYRVLDLSRNTFNDSYSSYFHRAIGGYSPVKMQRYQDLIDRHILREINTLTKAAGEYKTYDEIESNMPVLPVINMLNGKYIIIGDDAAPIVNSGAMGPCWFVNFSVAASTPDEEIDLLSQVDLHETAVIGEDFSRWRIPSDSLSTSSDFEDHIELTMYAPNELKYSYEASCERTAVFSEIYYPRGWKAVLEEGSELQIFRVNWTLRAVRVPAGSHEISLRFDPPSYHLGTNVSRASSILLFVLLVITIFGFYIQGKGIILVQKRQNLVHLDELNGKKSLVSTKNLLAKNRTRKVRSMS